MRHSLFTLEDRVGIRVGTTHETAQPRFIQHLAFVNLAHGHAVRYSPCFVVFVHALQVALKLGFIAYKVVAEEMLEEAGFNRTALLGLFCVKVMTVVHNCLCRIHLGITCSMMSCAHSWSSPNTTRR